jgi:hypothetical protein
MQSLRVEGFGNGRECSADSCGKCRSVRDEEKIVKACTCEIECTQKGGDEQTEDDEPEGTHLLMAVSFN